MKKFLIAAIILFAGYQAQAQGVLEFKSTLIEVDTVVTGDTQQKEFTFTNTGDKNLVIQKVMAMQAGSKPTWTRTSIPPGGSGKVTIDFSEVTSTKGQKTMSYKVYSNAKNKVVTLKINSFFKPKNPKY